MALKNSVISTILTVRIITITKIANRCQGN